MKILFCGGGTFGHIAPSVSVAEVIGKRYPNAQIAFVGRQDGAENESIRGYGYPLYELPIESIGKKSLRKSAKAIFGLFRSLREARRILKETSPDIVFGTGGYVCYPVMRMAQIMGIKTVVHESNAIPGRAVRMLAPRCNAVLLGVEEARDYLPKGISCIFTGNPVREDFFRYTRDKARRMLGLARGERLLLSFGGSGGARVLNDAMIALMQTLPAKQDGVYHVHACGRRYFEQIQKTHPEFTLAKGRRRVYPFIENMPLYMCAADLCICRSGAMTVAELVAARLPAILVPSPNVKDDHQHKNAESLAAKGGAYICTEDALDTVTESALTLLSDNKKTASMRTALSHYGKRDAAQIIANVVTSFLPDIK